MPYILFGPCDDPTFFDRYLSAPVASGDWAVFGAACPSWDTARAQLKNGAPDALVVWPGYASVPAWVWSAPVPVVAAAHDPNLLWSGFKHLLPLADLVLTDAPSAERLRRAGISHVRAANLFGLDRHFAAAIDEPDGERDLDVVFVGNLNPAVQPERLPWLARLARLSDQYAVRIASGVFGAEYRALLRRAKMVFNRAVRGECNLRALEAAASGAVLLQEAENEEVKEYLEPNAEYAPYTDEDFEAVVTRLLANGTACRAIAAAAKDRARWHTFDALVRVALAVGGKGWDEVKDCARARLRKPPAVPLAGRVWQRVSVAGSDTDPTLLTDLAAANDRHALGVLAPTAVEAETHFAASAATGNRVSAVCRAAALLELGRADEALAALGDTSAALEAKPELTPQEAASVPYPARFDHLRVAWERAGFDRAGESDERQRKARLLLARVRELQAQQSSAVADWEAAVACAPDRPHLRAGLGRALARADRPSEAAEHLRGAFEANSFDHAVAGQLVAALVGAGRHDEAERVRGELSLLAKAAPGLVFEPAPLPVFVEPPITSHGAAEESPSPEPTARFEAEHEVQQVPASEAPPVRDPAPPVRPAPPSGLQGTRFVDVPFGAFAAHFGTLDTSAALSGFTPPVDTLTVLTLVAHLRPRRVLEIGTAAGHMTANLTAFTPPDAVIYSLGIVAEDQPKSGAREQEYEVPRRDQFARFANQFGTAHKALFVTADSRAYDFARLAPLDLVFVDGGHDLATARSDSLAAYHALRPGGVLIWHDVPSPTPWVEVQRAIALLSLPELVYHVAGTQVAFLIKGEALGASAGPDSGAVAVAVDGPVDAVHSLAAVNRALGLELAARGNAVALVPQPSGSGVPATPLPIPPELAALVGRELPGAVTVRHRWPADFTPPSGSGPFVLIQPWEFGHLPRAWVEPVLALVDEVWCYSRSVARTFVASGVPESRLAIVPLGVDPDRFRPGLNPLPLATEKRAKLLFVGGTIPRKGFDVLLTAYRRAFTKSDDVCLVVKDMGVGTFYRDQTAGELVARFRADADAPELLSLTADLPDDELPRLYAACDALIHPYRGEGFGLPVLEAMACGLPVVATAGGPTDEFVPLAAGWRVPAALRYFDRDAVGDLATVGRPWWLEPDLDALTAILKEVVGNEAERAARGAAGRRAALGFTWARTAAAVEDRVRLLRARPPVRFKRHPGPVPVPARPSAPAPGAPVPVRPASTSLPPAFAPAVTLRTDVPFVVPAPPRERVTIPAVAGKPRVSLTMIVKNEEQNLPACLESVRDLVDEAVVIDTGSTDRTKEIAAKFGCVVGEFPWVDHFAKARNAALEKATGDYAFWMDADDRLDEPNRAKLRALLAGLSGGNDAFVMKCLCVAGRPGAGGSAVDHLRLFRLHPAHRWTYRVHEQILPALRATGANVQWSDVQVRHVGYIDPAVRRRKLDRDLRLLKLDDAERPDEPFTLFNLGSVYHERGDLRLATDALERSLAGSHPKDSIVRKAYALLARCHAQSGDRKRAEGVCRQGRTHYPEDAELLFLAAGYAREAGDERAAEGLYRKLIDGSEGAHFASVDTGLRAVKGRHNFAVMLLEQGRAGEAEALWRAALVHDPEFLPAQVGLGEVYAKTGNAAGLDRQVAALEALGDVGAAEAAVLTARTRTARGDHAGAVAVLESAVAQFPNDLGVRAALSHAHIEAQAPPDVLERALRGVLELDPHNAQAKHNLEVLHKKTGRWLEGVIDPTAPPPAG